MKTTARRWFVPRFSLRALLAIVTLSAIGMGVWYRWPIEEEKLYSVAPQVLDDPANYDWMPKREVRMVRRGLGNDASRPAWIRVYDFRDRLVEETLWKDNIRHGPTRRWHKGKLTHEGAYSQNHKEGVWKVSDSKHAFIASSQSWKRGVPHGEWKFFDSTGAVVRTIELRENVVIRVDGKPVDDPLMEKCPSGDFNSRMLTEQGAVIEFVNTPIKDVIATMISTQRIPIWLDARSINDHQISLETPTTVHINGAPLSIALVALLHPHGLVADYRFGRITICPAAAVANWRDRTGVDALKPPPGSALSLVWQHRPHFLFFNKSLHEAFIEINRATNVRMDFSAVPDDPSPRKRLAYQMPDDSSMKNIMGVLCDEYQLQVRLDGDTLIIEPQEVPIEVQ